MPAASPCRPASQKEANGNPKALASSKSAVAIAGAASHNWTVSCSAYYEQLMEDQPVRIELESVSRVVRQAVISLRLSVESGSVSLTLYDGNQRPVVLAATANQPAVHEGTIQVTSGPSVHFELFPFAGTATNVQYQVTVAG